MAFTLLSLPLPCCRSPFSCSFPVFYFSVAASPFVFSYFLRSLLHFFLLGRVSLFPRLFLGFSLSPPGFHCLFIGFSLTRSLILRLRRHVSLWSFFLPLFVVFVSFIVSSSLSLSLFLIPCLFLAFSIVICPVSVFLSPLQSFFSSFSFRSVSLTAGFLLSFLSSFLLSLSPAYSVLLSSFFLFFPFFLLLRPCSCRAS